MAFWPWHLEQGALGSLSRSSSLPRAGSPGAALFTAEAPSQISNEWEQAGGEEEAGSEVMGVGIGRERRKRRRRWKEGEAAPGEGGGEIERKAETNREEEDRGKKRRLGEGGGGGSARGECSAGFAG